jgi:hypothetical protein
LQPKVAITVMHTGTKSLQAHYEAHGYYPQKIDFPKKLFRKYPERILRHKKTQNTYFYGHPFLHHIEVMDELLKRDFEVVTTVRHPDDTAKSWAKRYKLGYSRHRPMTLAEQYEVWLEKVVPIAKVYRVEDFKEKANAYEGVDYNGHVDIEHVRDRVMEVYVSSPRTGDSENFARKECS